MISKESKNVSRVRRHARVRAKISGTAACPRLCVYRSNKNIEAQLIDDAKRVTLVASSSMSLGLENGSNIEAAAKVGADLANKAKSKKNQESCLRQIRIYLSRTCQGSCRSR